MQTSVWGSKPRMKPMKRSSIVIIWTTVCSLLISLSFGILASDNANAAGDYSRGNVVKVSSDLLDLVQNAQPGDRVNVILQSDGGWTSFGLDQLLADLNVGSNAAYRNFNMRAVNMGLADVLTVAANSGVSYISLDRPTAMTGHVTSTTGADAVRNNNSGSTTLDGSGIGIAVLDSGMYAAHKSFLDSAGNSRIVVSKDFTGEGRTDDPFGHGSHVASIAAGNGRISNSAYLGIAPAANLINLRVLNANGTGSTSILLSALDWVLSNRSTYNIRVVNLSLGAAAIDSYKVDPACKAVRKLVNAGVVVIAAAGNDGKDSSGKKIYGQIHSPGDEPSAITVGAANSFGTDSRSDDGITTYSSRGPTRGFWTDSNNVRHYDNLVKPDLVAPGNKIIDAEAPGNVIVTQHPELDAGVSNADNRKMMYMSGTSMATPAVAGAAALVLQANPNLTPNLVKMILMYTAQPLRGFNMLEQGTGQLNIEGAVRLAKLVRTNLSSSTSLGSALLTTSALPTPQSTIAGYTFNWSTGIVLNYTYASGTNLITKYQKFYGLGTLLSDGVVAGDGVVTADRTMMSDGVVVGDNILTSDGGVFGYGSVFCSYGVLLGDGLRLSDGQVFGDGVVSGDSKGVVAGDSKGVVAGDGKGVVAGDSAPAADGAAGMGPKPDSGTDYLGY
jgi:serine protease AprX